MQGAFDAVQSCAQQADDIVADGMSERIVDLLELVTVD